MMNFTFYALYLNLKIYSSSKTADLGKVKESAGHSGPRTSSSRHQGAQPASVKGRGFVCPLQERVPLGRLPGLEGLTKVSRHVAQETQVQIPEAALLKV